ncbi:MAG: lactoylglutathione lyase [Candidatus Thiodiazotropha taylori]
MSDRQRCGDKPHRILYTMIRVGDLERSVGFYRDILGMREIRRETFTGGRFTLAFMGYGDGESDALIELTYNWDEDHYEQGTGYGHIALEVEDVNATCKRLAAEDVNIVRAAGPMTWAVDETGHRENIAFIEDPDGYMIELVERHTD